MTMTVQQQRKADFDPNFRRQVMEHQKQADDEYTQRKTQQQYKWTMPIKNEWSGDLFDWEGIKDVFNRTKATEDYIKAMTEKFAPGVTGDLTITTTQIDYLAIMERSFRARHTFSWPRAVAHAIGRRRGHGHAEFGLFKKGIIDYIAGMIRESDGAP